MGEARYSRGAPRRLLRASRLRCLRATHLVAHLRILSHYCAFSAAHTRHRRAAPASSAESRLRGNFMTLPHALNRACEAAALASLRLAHEEGCLLAAPA